MTVRLLVQYGSYPPGTNYTGSGEAQLLLDGKADTNTSLGAAYAAPMRDDRDFGGNARIATVVFGSYDTVGKAGCDYLCRASDATSVIARALAKYRGTPSRFVFRGGTYNLDDNLTIDTSWITLEGELYPFWRKYDPTSAGGSAFVFPRSLVGNPGGAIFKQLTAGKGVWRVGTNYFDSDSRHKNINFEKLSMYCATGAQSGAAGQGTAIYDNLDTDVCRIVSCNVQGFYNAFNVAWDNPIIYDNNVQDTGGGQSGTGLYGAIIVRGYRGHVSKNVVFQVGGNGLWIGSNGCIVEGNVVGFPNDNGILVTNRDVKLVGNHISGIGRSGSSSSDGIVIGNYNTSPSADSGNRVKTLAQGTVIVGNTIQMNLDDNTNSATGIGNGVRIGGDSGVGSSNCDYTVVVGNYISRANATGATATVAGAYAVKIQNSSDYCVVSGNVINGPGWNAGAAGKIGVSAAGANCIVDGNAGGGNTQGLQGSATYDPASLADGAGATTTVTVTGAALGDYVTGVSFSLDLQGITLTGWVSAADTVSVRFQNESGGPIDLASGTLRARVVPK